MGRYHLVKALKDLTQAKVLAVGDDWQSIFNPFGDTKGFLDICAIVQNQKIALKYKSLTFLDPYIG